MTLLSIFQDFKMTSSSYLLGNVVSFFNGLCNLLSCRVGPGAPVLADVFLWLYCLSVLSGQCLLLRTSCCPTDVPFHSVQTDSCSLTKSLHHLSWASLILLEPVLVFLKSSSRCIPSLHLRIGCARDSIPSGIDQRIASGFLWGNQVASVAQFLYCIWAFLSHKKPEGVWVNIVFMKETCSPIHSERSNTNLSAWHSIIGFVHLLDYIDAFLLLSFTEILQSTFKRKAQLSYVSNGYDNNNIRIYSQYHRYLLRDQHLHGSAWP